jgi:ERCC4-related helicase
MTKYHSKYLAHFLTIKRSSDDIENLTRSISSAKVDLNPHQVLAALFALNSPLSKGAILADEVGLGKTIEAGLVIAQRWAEKKRHILLIVPASLRKQWEQELTEKFFLPVKILDSKKLKEEQVQQNFNPFSTQEHIVICSYPFAVSRQELVGAVKWDMIVIDEAHRLRNVYKNSSKQAKVLSEILRDRHKLLLTATPLQNNLMELYGLVSVIDPHVFGDASSFKMQFISSKDEEHCYLQLKERLKPIAIRTLRKQVQGYISFTNRIALTQEFFPSDDEHQLYEAVSAYLQRDHLCALPKSQRHLMTMVLRKLLASSHMAILQTLKALLKRLEKQAGVGAILDQEEMELFETLQEEWGSETQEEQDLEKKRSEKQLNEAVRQEIKELRSFIELAEKITKSSKSLSLLQALETAFNEAKRLGAAKKVVIFTESTRTQKYLYEFLSENGYQNEIVLINGSNTDKSSKEIYKSWLQANERTGKITGSKPVDIKAALVDYFKNDATIFLATEAAAEGINLQFCSLIINYDLPWNPQRVEQRIGRCHRYGQKHDVVVVNFINKRNEADQRVYDLLRDKFKLFDGVFGASDEVLGAIESGVDIEKRIAELYQNCRTSEEIQQGFDCLKLELDHEIKENYKNTKEKIFESLDEEVVALLKMHQDKTKDSISHREKKLFDLIRYELDSNAQFDLNLLTFQMNGITHQDNYCLNWRRAEEIGARFVREDDPLIKEVIEKAICRTLPVDELVFNYDDYQGKISVLEPLQGLSGWLELSLLRIESLETVEYLVFSGLTDEGEFLDGEVCEKMFLVPAHVESKNLTPPSFGHFRKSTQLKLMEKVEERVSSLYDEEVEKLDAWSEDLKIGLELELKFLDKEIKEVKKISRLSKSIQEKLEAEKKIKKLEGERKIKRRRLYEEQDQIEEKRDVLIEGLEKRIEPKVTTNEIFKIRWSFR